MSIQQTQSDLCQYITFKLGDELFAIHVMQAREVLELDSVSKVPTAPDYLRGVVNVRGNAIPVVDLRRKFGLPPAEDTPSSRIIVLELEIEGEACVLGGLADSVHEVIELETGDIREAPSVASHWRPELIKGLGKRDERFIIILDIEKAFQCDETEALLGETAASVEDPGSEAEETSPPPPAADE